MPPRKSNGSSYLNVPHISVACGRQRSKALKTHLKRIISNVKLTYVEFSTVLTQIEACLNSRPLVPLIADPSFSYRSVSLLRRWHLCQNLVRHFWQRWSGEYLTALNRYNKCHQKRGNGRHSCFKREWNHSYQLASCQSNSDSPRKRQFGSCGDS